MGNGARTASLTSKFLLSESLVNVIIRKLFIHVTLFFPRNAQPSLLPVKEVVSVLSLHKASQPSNNTGNEGETFFVRTTVRIQDKISIATRVPPGGSS